MEHPKDDFLSKIFSPRFWGSLRAVGRLLAARRGLGRKVSAGELLRVLL